jgi:hypothetical protein
MQTNLNSKIQCKKTSSRNEKSHLKKALSIATCKVIYNPKKLIYQLFHFGLQQQIVEKKEKMR